MHRCRKRRADELEQRPGLDERLLDLGLGLRVPDDPAADPEMDPAPGDGERANRQREVEVSVRVDASERPHRRAATDRLERRDVVESRDLRRAGHGAAGEHGVDQLCEADVLPQMTLDRRDEVDDAGERTLRHQLGPAHTAGLAHAREVVALEVDDHHVLGRVLLGAGEVVVRAQRARSLDRLRPHALPSPGEEELGRAGDDRPAVADERPRLERAERRERIREAGRVAREGRGQVLHEIDLVDVAGRDRGPNRVDRCRVLRVGPAPLPGADAERGRGRTRVGCAADLDCGPRQRTRLRRGRRPRPA